MPLMQNTINVIQLGIGFFLIFFAFNSQGFIEESVINSFADKGEISKHAGYTSLAIIYAVFTLANFLAAPIVGLLGPKLAMFLAALTYGLFQVGFLFLNEVFLYLSSAAIGVGAAVIWTAQGKYLSMNSSSETSSKHSGIFWATSQCCILFGGIFLFIVFQSTGNSDIDESTVRILYGVFTVVTVLGAGVLIFLRTKTDYGVVRTMTSDNNIVVSQKEVILGAIKLMLTKRMGFLILSFAYTGVELSFWSGIYPTCISFTKKLGTNTHTLVAFNAMAQGVGQIIGGLLFGIFGSKTRSFNRQSKVLLGTIVHIVCFILIFINFPSNAPISKTDDTGLIYPNIYLALFSTVLLGFGDACWNTQIFAHLIDNYPTKSAEAFSNFKFYQSLLTCACFFYSPYLQLQWHILILVILGVLGLASFVYVDRLPPFEALDITSMDDSKENEDLDTSSSALPLNS
uniref:UNC93-like protein MFSD11 n=1 Tax=Parastrongyloides trichosuri TaxID=131310 RepID=A0A0N4ZS88_PARTI